MVLFPPIHFLSTMLFKKNLLIANLALLLCSTPAWALSVKPHYCDIDSSVEAQYTKGKAYLDNNQMTQAQDCLEKAATKDYAPAQNSLAVLLFQKNPPDDVLAKKWLHKSAKQGFAKAQLNLGLVYMDAADPNVPNDPNNTQARIWFERAAAQKLPEAQYQLGQWYFDEQDYRKAKQYFTLAAKQNNADALMRMGEMHYAKGTASLFGNIPNLSLAKDYFEQAAAKNQAEAHYYLGIITVMESVEEPSLSTALSHFKKSCELGELEACPWQKDIEKDRAAFQKNFTQKWFNGSITGFTLLKF